MPRPEPEIIEPTSAASRVEGAYYPTGVMADEEWEYVKVPAGGSKQPPPPPNVPNGGGAGGGDMTPIWKQEIPRDVQFAKWGLTGLMALVGIFYWFVYLPDTKEIRRDIGALNTNVAVQTKAIGGIEGTLNRIEDRLDAQPKADMGQVRQPIGGDDKGKRP